MNIFAVTDIAPRNEIAELGGAHNFLISYSNSAPLVGELDDSILGSFELTRSVVKVDKYHASLIFAHCSFLPEMSDYDSKPSINVLRGKTAVPVKYFTGRELVSKILASTPVNYKGNSSWYSADLEPYMKYLPDERETIIEAGVMKTGVLDKAAVAKGIAGNLFHKIASEHGNQAALLAIYDIQQLALNYVLLFGYTIGIHDIVVSDESLEAIHKIESNIIQKSLQVTERLDEGKIIPPIDKTVSETFEEQQISVLKVMDDFVEPIFKSINPDINGLFKMVRCGSKGKQENISHMNSAIGQILINGERIRQNFSYRRTLAYFRRFDTTPESRGYITNSYMTGLTSPQVVFNSMNARFDFISKALSTAITGDQNRKSIKNLESSITDNFRAAVKYQTVIQYIYGEDAMDTRKVVKVKIPSIMMDDAKLEMTFKYKSDNPIFAEEFARIKRDRDEYRTLMLKLENSTVKDLMSDSRYSPVDVAGVLADFAMTYKTPAKDEAELVAMVKAVETFIEETPYLLSNNLARITKLKLPPFYNYATHMFRVILRVSLAATAIAKINLATLTSLLLKIEHKYMNAIVDSGAVVGIIAAQGFSAPFTQYMLDALHRAVAGGTSKDAVVKLKDVLGARSLDKTDAVTMHLRIDPAIASSRERTQTLANMLEVLTFGRFVTKWEIFFEKFGDPVHPAFVHEKSMIEEFLKYNPILKPPSDLLKWCVRFTLSRTTLILKNITLEYIVNRIRDQYPDLYVVHNSENSQTIVIRVYIRAVYMRTADIEPVTDLKNSLMGTLVRGVNGIRTASVVKMIRNEVNPDGSVTRADNVYGISTLGTSMTGVAAVEGVLADYIQSDNVDETYRMLGIEAARFRIISEMRNIGISNISYTHFSMYADEMTSTGRVTSIERAGLATRESANVLLRVGFSSPMQTLEEAAANSMEDKIYGYTGSLLVGTTPEYGTSLNKFYMNSEMASAHLPDMEKFLDEL